MGVSAKSLGEDKGKRTLSSSIDNFNEAHPVVDDQLFPICVLYCWIICLGTTLMSCHVSGRVISSTHLYKSARYRGQ